LERALENAIDESRVGKVSPAGSASEAGVGGEVGVRVYLENHGESVGAEPHVDAPIITHAENGVGAARGMIDGCALFWGKSARGGGRCAEVGGAALIPFRGIGHDVRVTRRQA